MPVSPIDPTSTRAWTTLTEIAQSFSPDFRT